MTSTKSDTSEQHQQRGVGVMPSLDGSLLSAPVLRQLLRTRSASLGGVARRAIRLHLSDEERGAGGRPWRALCQLALCHSETLRLGMLVKAATTLQEQSLRLGRAVLDDQWRQTDSGGSGSGGSSGSGGGSGGSSGGGGEIEFVARRRRLISAWGDECRVPPLMEQLVDAVPAHWTVIQITERPLVPMTSGGNAAEGDAEAAAGGLVVARFCGGRRHSLLISDVAAPESRGCVSLWRELDSILADNQSSTRRIRPLHAERARLDARMRALIASIERGWLGWRSYLLAGAAPAAASSAAASDDWLSEVRSNGGECLSVEQRERLRLLAACLPEEAGSVRAAVASVLGVSVRDPQCRLVADKITAAAAADGVVSPAASAAAGGEAERPEGVARGPVVLVLDGRVQHLPWESVWPLRCGPVTRVPSLSVLHALLTVPRPLADTDQQRRHSSLYVLNPQGDLQRTELRLAPLLQRTGWQGVVGHEPPLDQLTDTLRHAPLLAYFGHGSGSRYLPAERLRALHCRAAALLFGCGSGHLAADTRCGEVHGTPHNYLTAHCAHLLGFLWSLTDLQLDTFTHTVFANWCPQLVAELASSSSSQQQQQQQLPQPPDGGTAPSLDALSSAVWAARRQVSSPLLSAAAVVYGLPETVT